ncbi:MAG: ATP-binding protein, partial [Acetobacteraceae bacterium]
EAGRMELEKVAFSPAEITETLQAVMGPRARAKSISFHIRVDSSLPVLLVGDPGRLRQVLLNLVSNAVKFTDHGTVTVEASYLTISAAGATVEWRVHDTGIGIAEDKVEGLFSEFVQADGSINRRFGGSGLGLAISRRLAEQMGGTITVTSKLEQGSTFAFRVQLPIGTSTTEPPVVGLHPVQAIEDLIARMGRPLRILIAEDNETNQFVIRHMLKGFDIQVEIAKDGLEAITAADRSRQDAICMDMQMPEMDGLSATRTIRAKGGWQATVPIIALTGNAFQDDMQACLDAGMNAFIAKPVSRGQFLQTLADEISRCNHVPGRAPAQSSGDRHHIGPIRNNDEPRSYPAEPVVTAT